MAYGVRAKFEALRQLGFAGIGAAYAACGTATTDHTRLFIIFNATDKEVYVSTTPSQDEISIPSGVGITIDVTANKVRDDGLFFRKGTIFYLKQGDAGAPASGKVTITALSADGGV